MWPHTYTHRFGVDGIHHPELHRRNCSLMEGKGMAKNNKFIVKIIDHDNNSILQELSYQTRERAEEFKRISDRAYGKLLGENQPRITTEIFEL